MQTDGWQTGDTQGRVEACAAATESMNPTAPISSPRRSSGGCRSSLRPRAARFSRDRSPTAGSTRGCSCMGGSSWRITFTPSSARPTSPRCWPISRSFTARRLVEQLPREGRDWLLRLLAGEKAAHKTGSRHQVWQEGFHPQSIQDDAMMLQKLEYIHNNPVRRGWVASPEHWRWSSAHEWLGGVSPVLFCDPWK